MRSLFDPLPATTLEEPRKRLPTTLRTPPEQYQPYDDRSELQKGLDVGPRQFEAGMRGTAAAVGTLIGQDDFAREQTQKAQALLEVPERDRARVSDINDVHNLKDLYDYISYGVGSTFAPSAAGAVGAVAGGVVGGPAGAAAGAGLASGAQSGGTLFAEERQRLPDRDPAEIARASLVAGAGMGALDALPVVRAFDRLGVGKMGRRIVGNAIKSAAEEGGTEGLQTVIERSTRKFLDDNYDVFDEEGRNEILNSVAMGGLIGGGLGAASGVLPNSPFRDRVDELEAQDELRRVRVGRGADALREVAPEFGPELDALLEADDFDSLEELVLNQSKSFGTTFTPTDTASKSFKMENGVLASVPGEVQYDVTDPLSRPSDPRQMVDELGRPIEGSFAPLARPDPLSVAADEPAAADTARKAREWLANYYKSRQAKIQREREKQAERARDEAAPGYTPRARMTLNELDLDEINDKAMARLEREMRAKKTAKLYTDYLRKRGAVDDRAEFIKQRLQEGGDLSSIQRDVEIRDLLGEYVNEDPQASDADQTAALFGDSLEDDQMDSDVFSFGRTVNPDLSPTDVDLERSLSREAYEGLGYDIDVTPSERVVQDTERYRGDLNAEVQSVADLTADRFQAGQRSKPRAGKFSPNPELAESLYSVADRIAQAADDASAEAVATENLSPSQMGVVRNITRSLRGTRRETLARATELLGYKFDRGTVMSPRRGKGTDFDAEVDAANATVREEREKLDSDAAEYLGEDPAQIREDNEIRRIAEELKIPAEEVRARRAKARELSDKYSLGRGTDDVPDMPISRETLELRTERKEPTLNEAMRSEAERIYLSEMANAKERQSFSYERAKENIERTYDADVAKAKLLPRERREKAMEKAKAKAERATAKAKAKADAAREPTPREIFIESLYQGVESGSIEPEYFLNMFSVVRRYGVPKLFRREDKPITWGGKDSIIQTSDTLVSNELRMKHAEGAMLYAVILEEVQSKNSRPKRNVVFLPTTIKRVYEQVLGGNDINEATIPEIYQAFLELHGDLLLNKGYRFAPMLGLDEEQMLKRVLPDETIVAMQYGEPITWGILRGVVAPAGLTGVSIEGAFGKITELEMKIEETKAALESNTLMKAHRLTKARRKQIEWELESIEDRLKDKGLDDLGQKRLNEDKAALTNTLDRGYEVVEVVDKLGDPKQLIDKAAEALDIKLRDLKLKIETLTSGEEIGQLLTTRLSATEREQLKSLMAKDTLEDGQKAKLLRAIDKVTSSMAKGIARAREMKDQFIAKLSNNERQLEAVTWLFEQDKFESAAEDLTVPSPEFASKEAVRFRASSKQLALRDLEMKRLREQSAMLQDLAEKVLGVKSDKAARELLAKSGFEQDVLQRVARDTSSLSFRNKLVDALDELAYQRKFKSLQVDLQTIKTWRRDDELNVPMEREVAVGSAGKKSSRTTVMESEAELTDTNIQGFEPYTTELSESIALRSEKERQKTAAKKRAGTKYRVIPKQYVASEGDNLVVATNKPFAKKDEEFQVEGSKNIYRALEVDLKAADGKNQTVLEVVPEVPGVVRRLNEDLRINRSTSGLNGWNAGRTAAPEVRKFEEKERRLLGDWVRALGVKREVTFVSTEEIYGLKPSKVPDKILKAMRQEFLGGTRGAIAQRTKRKDLFIAVNHTIRDAKLREAVMAHEFGHVVFKDQIYGHLTKNTLARAVETEFHEWLKKTKGKTTGEVLRSKLPVELFDEYSPELNLDAKLRSLPREQVEYFLDFEEWFADNVSRWLKRSKTTPPEGMVARFFWQLAQTLRSIWGVFEEQDFKPAASVDAFMRGAIYKAHGVHADRWVETLSGHIPYPQDLLQAVDQESLKPLADRVYDAAMLQRLVPYSDVALRHAANAFDVLLTPAEKQVVQRVFSSQHVRGQVLEYVQANLPQHFDRAVADSRFALAVGYQMWLQGEVEVPPKKPGGKPTKKRLLDLGPEAKSLYARLDGVLEKHFGLIADHNQAAQILTAMSGGLLTLRHHHKGYFSLRTRSARDTLLKRAGQSLADVYRKVQPLAESLFYPVQRRLLNTGNGALRRLAETMAPIAGQRRDTEPYFVAKARQTARLQEFYARRTEGWSEDFKRDVWEHLYDPERPIDKATELGKAVRDIRALFQYYYRYAEKHIGFEKRKDYFPWVFNTRAIQDNAASFLALVRHPKNAADIERLARTWDVKPKEVPEMILANILDQNGSAEMSHAPSRLQHSPYFAFADTRTLQFLYKNGDASERELLRSWMDQNMDHTVYMYADQLVKRVEFARRFGKKGEVLKALLEEAKETGATDKELQLADDFVAAMLGYHGRRTNAALHRLFGKDAPTNEVINPTLKNVMSTWMVVQNMALLGLATFSSLIDPVGIGVRAGDMGTAMKAYRAGVKEMFAATKKLFPGDKKKQMSHAEEMARAIGIIEERLIMESLSWQYSSTYLPHWVNTMNEGFFKLIGLNQWTQLSRVMATAGAEQFLLAHASGKKTKDSKRYLEELGLRPGDVKRENNQVKLLTREERSAASKEELARDDRVRAALFQFVDETIVRPSPNVRALWMSDPHFMLIGHLKGFMYAFHEQVLSRVWGELARGNFGAPALLMGYVPVMMMANMLREGFKELATGEEPPDDPFFQAFWEAMQRAGLTGIFQIFFDAKRDTEYGGTVIDSMLGPTWQNTVKQLPEIMSGNEDAVIDQLPLQNLLGDRYEDLLPLE